VDGEVIPYTFRPTFKLPNQVWNYTIETIYNGEPIDIDDHGYGLEWATFLLENNISIKKDSRKSSK
jgi:hypothetical protein